VPRFWAEGLKVVEGKSSIAVARFTRWQAPPPLPMAFVTPVESDHIADR